MTEEEFQELLKEVWEERTPVERGDIPARPSGIPYESFEAYEAAVRGSEIYSALTATNAANAKNLLREGMRTGMTDVERRQSIAWRTAQRDLEGAMEETSILGESFFEEDGEEVEPELTQQEIERRGAEIQERIDAEEVAQEDLSEEDQDYLEAFIARIAAQGELGRQTMQLYGLTTGMIPDWLESLQEEARVAGLGDFTTKDLVDELEFGNNAALMGAILRNICFIEHHKI